MPALLGGRYQLEGQVGQGASATVYRALDKTLDAVVALKLANPSPALSARFRAEAAAAMRLSHPRIVRVHTYDRDPPWEFLVMEWVDGPSLNVYRQRRAEKRLSCAETISIGLECLDALEHAHTMGFAHHDVKPANILISPSGIKLCDFGLAARTVAARPPHGPMKVVAGTPSYISPERVRGEPGDHRSDLYSLAATLYAMGNGAPLFHEDNAYYGHLHLPPPASRHLPPPLDEILRTALAKDPARRFQSAQEMRAALLEAAYGQDPSTSIEIVADEPSAPDEWVAIPAVTLRTSGGGAYEVRAFTLSRTPVTNAQYYLYLEATGAPPPFHWRRGLPPLPNHPVVGVTLDEARRYAAWRGGRLPHPHEWEAAARGTRGTAFPWGAEWDPRRCQCHSDGTAPVDQFPDGASPEGCLDLVGNVWEWTEPDAPGDHAWVMGGCYRHRFVADAGIPRTQVRADKAYEYLGFRCLRSREAR
jgi:formylglycine-generating enzyme required for sulfatase activity/tRNA A-37 threonylcarbamoyl transferase component Bud32